ncbi:hypothetical protein Patl1_03775 [Pistacia atlantica]|uniref:Uncharacterized protein n=1 Tax=Pistacia atlantica TaxID=434234 RepID=A0ACC1BVV1_9ROSI|nr:hypothetical protein Patl1_03775 [Pistacia atlantica]
MPQETNYSSSILISPCKNLRGLKTLVSNNEASYTEEIINDYELAQRKAEEAGDVSQFENGFAPITVNAEMSPSWRQKI